jgi:hypothetical protein
MKTKKTMLVAVALLSIITCSAIENVIVLTPTVKGSEGSQKFTDESMFIVETKSDTVSCYNSNENDDWTVESSKISVKEVKGKSFSILFGAASAFDMTAGASYGAILTPAGIDRASNGALGVLGGLGNGIDTNEGFQFGLNLSNLPTNVTVQISKVFIQMINPKEIGVVVSRLNPEKSISFGVKTPEIQVNLPNNGGWLDVNSLELKLKGGKKMEEMISLICTIGTTVIPNNEKPSYRIKGIELRMIKE